jgi:hypothetical protein
VTPTNARGGPQPDRSHLERLQARSLWLADCPRLRTAKAAERFLERVGIALRYQASPTIPLASLRSAIGPDRDQEALATSVALTNHLLSARAVVEVNVVAGRLSLIHHTLVPALYALVRRGAPVGDLAGLSQDARAALALMESGRHASVGEMRRRLGVTGSPRPDRADSAVAELQQRLLVDRGPFDAPSTGIPYLAADGYPYRVFHTTHAALVRAASRLTVESALDAWLGRYLDAAIFASPRKLASLFKGVASAPEIAASLARLEGQRAIALRKVGRETLAIAAAAIEGGTGV